MIKIGKNEKILLEVRRHWFILFSKTLFLVFLLVLPIGIIIAFNMLGISNLVTIAGDGTFVSIILTSVWLLFIWITFFVIWTDYYLDILIITDKRVIDIEQQGLFSRNIAVSGLEHIEDVTTEVCGLIATLLGFGNIRLQTAAESREFKAIGIPNPSDVRRRIMKAHENAMKKTYSSQEQ